MNAGIITGRYARTLLLFATESKQQESIYAAMKRLMENYRSLPGLKESVINKRRAVEDKRNLLLAASGITSEHSLARFFDLILTNRRESYLQRIGLYFIALYRADHHISRVKIATPVPLEETVRAHLIHKLEDILHGTIELTEHIEPELIGGFVVKVGDYRIDASIATRLKRIQKRLIKE